MQLSAVRRVLRGGVLPDRASVRLDLTAVHVDLETWWRCSDDQAIVDGNAEVLPEDRYEDWSVAARQDAQDRFIAAARRLGETAEPAEAVRALRRVVETDHYDEAAFVLLARRLRQDGRPGEAAEVEARLARVREELGSAGPLRW